MWLRVTAAVPAAVMLSILVHSTPKSKRQWIWGAAGAAYVAFYYFFFVRGQAAYVAFYYFFFVRGH